MRFGFVITAGDPRTGAHLAAEAEGAGWDGVFAWTGSTVESLRRRIAAGPPKI